MHRKLIIFLFFAAFSHSQDVNWERVNSCPVGDPDFVEKVMMGMTVEEKVGQTIMADLTKSFQAELSNIRSTMNRQHYDTRIPEPSRGNSN